MTGKFADRRFIGLEIDRDDASDRCRSETFSGQSPFHVVEEFGCASVPLTADADGEVQGRINESARTAGYGISRDKKAEARLGCLRQAGKPGRCALGANALARKHIGHEGFQMLWIGKPITFGPLEIHTEAELARRRN